MAEDDIMKLLCKSGQTSDPPILRGSGSGGGGEGENVPVPPPPEPPPVPQHHQNLFIQKDEMAAWLHHQSFGSSYTPASALLQSFVSLAPPPPENILSPWIPVVTESTGYSLIPVTGSTETRPAVTFSHTFVVPGLGRKKKAVETKAETEPIQIQPGTETTHDRKREEREETIEETKKESGGSATRKRSRAAEMHNQSERRRRERINDRMRALQELMPRCNKSDKASMLDDAVEYMKSLQMQVQMMSSMIPAMDTPDMQRFMPHMAMGMNRPPYIPLPGTSPFPSQAHMAGLGPSYPVPPYPFPTIQAFDPSRIHIPPSHQHNPVLNQPQFSGYWNPYGQFVGPPQIQQPPPLHNQTITSQPSFGQASNSKEPEDEEKQPTD